MSVLIGSSNPGSIDSIQGTWTSASGTSFSVNNKWIAYTDTATSVASVTSVEDLSVRFIPTTTRTTTGEWVSDPWISYKNRSVPYLQNCRFIYNYNSPTLWSFYEKTPGEKLKEILSTRIFPRIRKSSEVLPKTADIREMRARDTLRRVIGDEKYFRFLKRGFVTVQAKSGLDYQIFPGDGIARVYNKGKMITRLCVVLSGNFPPTDSLIMRYLMILNNEEQFKSLAIKHSVISRPAKTIVIEQPRKLIDIYKELKAA